MYIEAQEDYRNAVTDSRSIRTSAVQQRITYFTTMAGAPTWRTDSMAAAATACSFERALAARMRASTASGTVTPGTSFARNSALRAETSGQMPATMGIQILIVAVQPKLGRDVLLINCAGYLLGLIGRSKGMMLENPMVFMIFNAVGIGSAVGAGYLVMKTKQAFTEWRALLVLGAAYSPGVRASSEPAALACRKLRRERPSQKPVLLSERPRMVSMAIRIEKTNRATDAAPNRIAEVSAQSCEGGGP